MTEALWVAEKLDFDAFNSLADHGACMAEAVESHIVKELCRI